MAPKGVKRVAASAAGGARKRTNADPVNPKCKEVVSAVNQAESLPEHCKEMLSGVVGSSLTVFAAERHAYQKQAVQMLGETMAAVHKQMQNAVSAAQAKVNSSDLEKASRTSALDKAQKNLASLEQSTTAAQEALEGNKAAVGTAKANLATANAAVEAKEAEVTETSELKTKLETMLKEVYEPLKTSKASMKALHSLEKIFRDVDLEAGLIDSLPDTFKKDPEARGTFDGIVVKHVETQTARYLAKSEKDLQDAEHSKTALATAKAATEAALAAAEETNAAGIAAEKATEATLKEGKAGVKQAQAAVNNFEKEMANFGTDLEDANETLTDFTEGAQKSFAALRDLAPPPEPEPEAAVEAAAEEAAAEAVEAPVA